MADLSGMVCGCPLCRKTSASGSDASTAAAFPQYDVRVPGSLPYYTAALLPSSQPHWGSQIGSGTTITYSFMETAPSYASTEDQTGFAAMNSAQRAASRLALEAYTAISGLRFEEVSDTGQGGSIRFGTNTQTLSSGYAYYPSTDASGGDVYVSNAVSSQSFSVGGFGYALLLHEIGHAIGLKHPGNYNAGGGGAESPYLPTSEDSTANTVMSYNGSTTMQTLQSFDIAAIQYLYGVNNSARISNDLYLLSSGDGGASPLIWDGGGNDTLSGAGQTTGMTIDLRQGGQSAIGTKASSILTAGNLSINFGTVIENAIGGSGADTIIGNDADNIIDGGAGADSIDGSNGTDTVTYAGSDSAVNVSLVTGVGGGGYAAGDTLVAIENLIGSANNDVFVSGAGANRLDGGAGNDTVSYAASTAAVIVHLDNGTAEGGYATSDVLVGIENLIGSGYDDTLYGTSGDNQLYGGAGNDVLYGQGGADFFDGGTGFDTVVLGGTGATIQCIAAESLIGTTGSDFVILGAGGNSVSLSLVETLIGGSGADWIALGGGGGRLIMVGVETMIGGAGNDWLDLGNRGNTLILASTETLIGGANSDLVTLGNRGNTLILAGVETVIGGVNTDLVTLGNRGGSLVIGGVETLTGGTGKDFVSLADGGNSLTMSGVETLVGGVGHDLVTLAGTGTTLILAGVEELLATDGNDWINLGNRGNTMTLTGGETLVGGAGIDVVTLGGTTNTIILTAIEALSGSDGVDQVTLGNRGNTITIQGVETVIGGTGSDFIIFGSQGAMAVSGVETIVGSGGNDTVTLGGTTGGTVTIAALETLTGTVGADWVNLGNLGNTTQIKGIETLIGGTNTDIVILGDVGVTMILTGVETLVGSSGVDVVTLGNRGNSLSVSNVETLFGGSGIDDVTVIGGIRFEGRGGSDTVRLQVASNVDTIVLSSIEDGGSTQDTITNFSSGTDRLLITGALRTAIDHNADGVFTTASRATGSVTLASDELVTLTSLVSALTDTDYASFRQALGSVTASDGTTTSLVLASDGIGNSGLYAVTDNGDGVIAAGEVRLLSLTPLTRLVAADVLLG
jgi:Ca2+-binding RTX toxin-like protein